MKEDKMDNVVNFPGVKRPSPAQNMDEVHNNINEAREEQIEIIVHEAVGYLMHKIFSEGYDVGDEKCMKSQFLLEEAMKGLMYKAVDMYHPIQDMSEELFALDEEANDNKEEPETA